MLRIAAWVVGVLFSLACWAAAGALTTWLYRGGHLMAALAVVLLIAALLVKTPSDRGPGVFGQRKKDS